MIEDNRDNLKALGVPKLRKLKKYIEYRLDRAGRTLENSEGDNILRSQGATRELRKIFIDINSLLEGHNV